MNQSNRQMVLKSLQHDIDGLKQEALSSSDYAIYINEIYDEVIKCVGTCFNTVRKLELEELDYNSKDV